MFKVIIENTLLGLRWEGRFSHIQDAQNWMDLQKIKPNRSVVEAVYTVIDMTEEFQLEQVRKERMLAGKEARETCLKVLDMVAGYNLQRQLTIEQISSMTATLGQPMQALQAGRPGLAKQLIQNITADEIVTQEMIDEAIQLLSGY